VPSFARIRPETKKVPICETFFVTCMKTHAHVAGFHENESSSFHFLFHALSRIRNCESGRPARPLFADFAGFWRQTYFYCVLTGTKAEYFIKICTLLLAKAQKNML
ncbi:hypothetical protein, partial [Agathobaculum sp.]|uniref:hypothetical protein n=1 Tax=Agathobaculum sp. TaxID=2048138 RepID=UPI0027BA3FFE